MLPGTPERRSHDYVRHGTIDLFAALNTATGKVIGHLSAQHRAIDFRDFLDEIDRQTDPALAIHVICDNLSAHKAPAVHRWLFAHPRVQLHFTPTYSSWISQVERWFAELQRRCLDRGVFCSLDELTTALEDWIKIWNASARPFKWTKTADQIIDRICRYCSRISGPGHQEVLDRNELGALLVAAGLGPPSEHALISLLALNGLRVSEATSADIEHLGLERGHRTLTITRIRAARSSPSRWRRGPPGRSTWPPMNALMARSS